MNNRDEKIRVKINFYMRENKLIEDETPIGWPELDEVFPEEPIEKVKPKLRR